MYLHWKYYQQLNEDKALYGLDFDWNLYTMLGPIYCFRGLFALGWGEIQDGNQEQLFYKE